MDMDVGQPTEVAAASRPFLAFFSSSAQIAEEQARPCSGLEFKKVQFWEATLLILLQ